MHQYAAFFAVGIVFHPFFFVFIHVTLLTQPTGFALETFEAKWTKLPAILDFGGRCHTSGAQLRKMKNIPCLNLGQVPAVFAANPSPKSSAGPQAPSICRSGLPPPTHLSWQMHFHTNRLWLSRKIIQQSSTGQSSPGSHCPTRFIKVEVFWKTTT